MAESYPAPQSDHPSEAMQFAIAVSASLAIVLSASLAAAVRDTIAAELHSRNQFVLTGDEAAVYCRLGSYRAFSAWRRRFHVPACGHKRFAVVKLDMGLERESRLVRARF